jgi:glycosyltransferase involved in cell wall biosynthesis
MKIGIVTANVNVTGGVQIFTRDLERLLSKRGHETSVFGLDTIPKQQKDLLPEEQVGNYFNEINETENFDLVICNGEFGYSVEHPRAINIFHGNNLGYANSVSHLVPKETTSRRLEKVPLQKKSSEGKYVVSISNFASEGLTDSGILVNQVIPLSVDTTIFYPTYSDSKEHTLSLSRGRMYEKGFDILEKLADAGVKMKVFSDYKIKSPNVNGKNFKNNKTLNKEYNEAKLFLNPTRFEGGGLTTLEAMACACPVITTLTGYGLDIQGEIPEFIVSDLENISEYLDRIELIGKDRKKYGEKAREYFLNNHNPETFKKEWVSLIENF